MTQSDGMKNRIQKQGEEALGRLAQELIDNPIVHGAVSHAGTARERAAAAQEFAMAVLGMPSAADLERLTRRVRAVGQRLESIEDAVDRLDRRLAGLTESGVDARLEELIAAVDRLAPAEQPAAQKRATRGAAAKKPAGTRSVS